MYDPTNPPVELTSLYLATHIPSVRPPGRAIFDPHMPEVRTARTLIDQPPPPPRVEAPLQTFTQSLAVAGTFTVRVAGNFLRYNASVGGGGSDRVQIRLKVSDGDTQHAPLSFYPGQRIRGRSFSVLEIIVPTAVAGAVAEFVYTQLNPGEEIPEFA
jgi:hypothetical protein